MKSWVLILLIAGLITGFESTIAQEKLTTRSKKAIEAYNSGIRNYTLNKYTVAAQYLETAIAADPGFIEAYLVLAEVYESDQKPDKAIKTYRKALPLNENYYPYGLVRLGNLEYREGLYENALASYSRFVSLNSGNDAQIEKAKDGIARCVFSIEAMKHPVDFNPATLDTTVNTPYDEYWPGLSADEKTLVVTRLIPSEDFMKQVQEDFFISQRTGSGWGAMKNAGWPLNTPDNEGAQTISGDGRYMIFTACNRSDGIGRCDLYASTKKGDNWSVPVNLGRPVNSAYRETQPSMTPDGRTLYFSSDRPGGKGQHDIWVSHLDKSGKWTNPENLGDSVNSKGTEMSPFIHPDNQSLYFSSDGHIGLGGHDLFFARRDSTGAWKKPVNLGYPINTNRDEIGLIVNSRGNKAYYSSDVNQAQGKDIYVFDLPYQSRPVAVTYMKGKVFDARDLRLLRAQFELVDLETGIVIYNSWSDSLSGEFLVSIPGNRNYMLNVSKTSYLFFSENFSLKEGFDADRPFLIDVPLQPIVAGNSIVLRNVFFETDSYALKNESKLELNKVVELLKANPGIRIEIGGHTDNTGSAVYNLKLSENRAKAVADYLKSASVAAERIVSKGYGMDKPIAGNESEEGRSQNRRTEMKIL